MTVSSATGLASTAPAPARNHVEVPELRRTATPRGLGWAAFLTAVALVVFDQIDLLVRYSSRWTTIDQTLLWDATRELRAGHLSEPYFYGQRYGTVWETLPAVLLRALGLGPATAVPLATSLGWGGCWLAVAAAAWRIGHRRLAMLLPLVLLAASTRYLVLLSAPRGVGAGMLLASLAVAAFLLARDHPAGLTALVGLGSVAALFDLGSLLVVAPLIAYAVVRERKDPTLLRRLGLALVPAAAWLLGTT